MNMDRWDYKDFDGMDSFRILPADDAGLALFWIVLIVLLVTDFGRIFL